MDKNEHKSGPPQKKVCSEEEERNNSKSFTPRDYQIEILESAKDHNTIACLGTGTGKTFIAVMLIRELAHTVRIPFDEGGKKIFFLVPTVPLVTQQARVIAEHTELTVGRYYGEMEVDSWSKDDWTAQFRKSDVLVMTAEICRIILSHSFLPVSRISLLILDECHRARGNHPYSEVMKCFSGCCPEEAPKVFGLSASLLNGKCKPIRLESELRDLEKTLRSTIETANDIGDLQKYGTDPKETLIVYRSSCSFAQKDSPLIEVQNAAAVIKEIKGLGIKTQSEDISFIRKPEQSLNQLPLIFNTLGPWCAYKAAEIYCTEIDHLLLRTEDNNQEIKLKAVKSSLLIFIDKCKKLNCDVTIENLEFLPHKLQRFLALFRAVKKRMQYLPVFTNPVRFAPNFEESPEAYRKYLEDCEKEIDKAKSPICGIIFVEQRITAYVLCQWISEVSNNIQEFNFLKPEFVVGHGALRYRAGAKETSMSVNKQRQVILDFQDKKFNILIATSVLEEGMDIQKCNVVVRFDLPKDFRSYVQSKGRARAQNSIYALFASDTDRLNFMDDLCSFKTIEDMLLKKCHNREMPSEEEIQEHLDNDLLPPYMPVVNEGSPRITLSSAIGLINRYCSRLPCDMTTKLTPRWHLTELDPNSTIKEYKCTLWLPINSPLRKPIIGETMKRKRLAKMAAALEACKQLHIIGELNENLIPISNKVEEALKDELGSLEEEETQNGIQPGTNRRRQIYQKGVADVLKNCLPSVGVPCYLHVFEMDLVVPLAVTLNPRGRPLINPADTKQGFGLLTTKKLPQVCKFPIFTKCGKVLVDVKCVDQPLFLSQMELDMVCEFHKFIFTDVLFLENEKKHFSYSADFSCYIVPIDAGSRNSLDWDFITFTKHHDYNIQKLKDKKTVTKTKFTQSLFEDAVVTRSYMIDQWKLETPVFHFVTEIAYDLSPNDFMDEIKLINFKAHYKLKYDVEIVSDDQPLLNTERCEKFTLWKPLYITLRQAHPENGKKKSKIQLRHEAFREYLIPELCIVHPFPAPLFRKASYIPTILFRLNHLLLAEQIRYAVAADGFIGQTSLPTHFKWPVFNLEQSDKELREHLMSKGEIPVENYNLHIQGQDILKSEDGEIVSFEVKTDIRNHLGPNPSCLLQALTAKSAGDEFNLERLETIGDSFLKFSMSVKLYAKYPIFDEGKLTELRMRLIRNLHLYKLAKKKHLPQFLVHMGFNCKHSWLPPCYDASENMERKSIAEKSKHKVDTVGDLFKMQVISDKCVADSVEALIGAYLLSCGYQGALQFMSWIGLNAFIESDDISELIETDSLKWPPLPRNPIVVEVSDIKYSLSKLTSGLEKFEERIGYKFNEIAYLVQAFTHASYSYNEITDCYQRLEFLGDAVLDYLITRKLYDDPKEHSPGDLTDLRSALVNNVYFASLAVKYGFHKNLKMLSATLHKLTEHYIDVLQSSDAFKNFEMYGYYLEEIECFDLEEVEVPKALGDIFESVAGAIYLDSGSSLDAVWKVYYPMMKPAIDHLSHHVPKSPVRELLEEVHDRSVFSTAVVQHGKTYIEVTLPDGNSFVGIGPNKHVAKRSAAKRAVSHIRRKKK